MNATCKTQSSTSESSTSSTLLATLFNYALVWFVNCKAGYWSRMEAAGVAGSLVGVVLVAGWHFANFCSVWISLLISSHMAFNLNSNLFHMINNLCNQTIVVVAILYHI